MTTKGFSSPDCVETVRPQKKHSKAATERALFCKIPEIRDEFVDAVPKGTTTAFGQRLYRAEATLFDDVDYLTGKTQTQEEFEKLQITAR
jgi:chromosomal replication initiation ATPase DnaA